VVVQTGAIEHGQGEFIMKSNRLMLHAVTAVAIAAFGMFSSPRISVAATAPNGCLFDCCGCDDDDPACYDDDDYSAAIYADCRDIGCGNPNYCSQNDIVDCGAFSTYFECDA
jgi:hypothetical protein